MSFFEKITDGLRLYEVILLMMGVIFFLALVIIFIVYAAQQRPLKPLFMFFAVPVLMLVWPSIAKIKIDGEGADIQTKIAAVEQNPTEENKEKLKDAVETLEGRGVKDPTVLKKVMLAHYLLGDTAAAKATIQRLPADIVAKDTTVKKVVTSIDLNSRLQKQINIVNQSPTDSTKIKELNAIKTEASTYGVKSEQLEKSINIATEKVETYRTINPRVVLDPKIRLRPQ
jgi:hypothetical protein